MQGPVLAELIRCMAEADVPRLRLVRRTKSRLSVPVVILGSLRCLEGILNTTRRKCA